MRRFDWSSGWQIGLAALTVVWSSACSGPAQAPTSGTPGQAAHVQAQRAGRKVLLEIDRMQGTPPIDVDQVVNGANVSLRQMYADAGIELEIQQDQADLPRVDEVSLADLHAMMTSFRTVQTPPDVLRVHALVVTRELNKPGTLGVMFDYGEADADARPREGFAIFADAHANLGAGQAPELLLTLAHELAHCFNLHHPDWEGRTFAAGSTVESYSLADSVKWSLSESSKAHLRSDPAREVWPGKANIGFALVTREHLGRHRSHPPERFEVVDLAGFNQRRPASAQRSTMAERSRARILAPDAHPVRLRLEAPKQQYRLGEPVALTVALHNTGATRQSVYPLLDPRYRFLNVEVKGPGDQDFRPFQPLLVAEARGVDPVVLDPSGAIHEEARIFFGASGWVTDRAGAYQVRADYPAPDQMFVEGNRLQTEVLDFTVVEPTATAERRVAPRMLDPQAGLFLFLGGGDHLKSGVSILKQVISDAPQAPQAAAARLALGTAALNPTIDPATGVRSAVRLEEALAYLPATVTLALPELAVATAQKELVESLDEGGRHAEADRVHSAAVRRMGRSEAAQEVLRDIREPGGQRRIVPPPK